MTLTARAVGVIRISRVGDREGERFLSPQEQRDAIARVCQQRGFDLYDSFEEPNVSGGWPLRRRRGLLAAVQAIESGHAQVLVVAFFDRLARHLGVLGELLERVEAAGGKVMAADVGDVGTDTAARWLSSTTLGMVADYFRRVTRERTTEARRSAVERGIPPYPTLAVGYRRTADGRVEVDPEPAAIVHGAFELRASGATIKETRDFLRRQGVPIDHARTRTLLRSRFVLGELRHGKFVRLDAHPAIVERELWARVQQLRIPRGRRPASERLLARLGIVRCRTCNRPLSVGAYFKRSNGERVATYTCSQPDGVCPRPARINADVLEQEVSGKVWAALRKMEGLATAEGRRAQLEEVRAERQAELERAVATLEGFEDVVGAREKLLAKREAVDEIDRRIARLPESGATRRVSWRDWPKFSTTLRRGFISDLVERVIVDPGRGPGRVHVQLFREQASSFGV